MLLSISSPCCVSQGQKIYGGLETNLQKAFRYRGLAPPRFVHSSYCGFPRFGELTSDIRNPAAGYHMELNQWLLHT
jgi:hypothetical protein